MKIMYKVLFLLLIVTNIFADQYNDNSPIFKNAFFCFGVNYLEMDFTSINNLIENDFGIDKLDKNFFIYSGEISGHLSKGIMLGVKYNYGTTSTNGTVTIDSDDQSFNLNRNAIYSIKYGGLVFGYVQNVYGAFEYYGGGSMCYGNLDMVFSQSGGNQTFGGIIGSFDPNSSNYKYNRSVLYNSSLWIFEAYSGLRFYFKKGIAIGMSVGYIYGISQDRGTINYDFENIMNVPDFSFNKIIYSVDLYFGN